MFKKVLLSVFAFSAITACSVDEIERENVNPNGENYITVSPIVPKATRGVLTTPDILQNDANGFYVVSYGNNAFYFNRTKAIYSATGKDGIASSPGYFLEDDYAWPSYDLTFAAWYPTVLPSDGGKVDGAYKSDNVSTMPGEYVSQPMCTSGTLTRGQSIRGFVPATDYSKQTDIVMARTRVKSSDYKNSGNAVSLNFRHIMSQISVQAAKTAGENIKIEIAKVELRNIPSKGTFDFIKDDNYVTDGHYGDAGVTPAVLVPFNHWSLDVPEYVSEYGDASISTTNLQRYPCELNSVVTLGPTVSDNPVSLLNGGNMLLIPVDFNGNYVDGHLRAWNQTITPADGQASGAYLAMSIRVLRKSMVNEDEWDILYPLESTPASRKETIGGTEYGKAAAGIITSETKWEPGRRYVYTLNFTDNGVGKTDPEYPGGGDDILGDSMWFTVTVDTWNNVTYTPDL